MADETEIEAGIAGQGWFARLTEPVRAGLRGLAAWFAVRRDRVRRVRELESFARTVLSAGVLDDPALAALVARQCELGLMNEDLGALPRRMVNMIVCEPMRSNRMSPAQDRSLDLVVSQFGASESQVSALRRQLSQARLLYDIDAGHLPTVAVSGLLLQNGEQAHWAEPGVILEERVVSRQYEGGSSGVSIRIAKGLTYRVGRHRGQLVSKRAMVPVSEGMFVMTSRRVLFNGSGRSVAARWEKVLSFNVLEDGCVLTIENRSHSTVIQFRSRQNTPVISAVAARLAASIAGVR